MAVLSNAFLAVCVCVLVIGQTAEVQGHCGGIEGKLEEVLEQRTKVEEVLHDAGCGIQNAATAVKDAFANGFQFLKDKLGSYHSDDLTGHDPMIDVRSGN